MDRTPETSPHDQPEDASEVAKIDNDLAPDIIGEEIYADPVQTVGPDSWGPDDVVSDELEVYTPPSDPVVATDDSGNTEVLGGFGSDAIESMPVARSASDGQYGDEAIADAIRRELREDAMTTDLTVDVEVRNGVVHLRGRVEGPEDAEAAQAVAARLPGVVDVRDELEVATV